jgi:hypothetical protein
MTLVSSSLKTYTAANPPAWAGQKNFGFDFVPMNAASKGDYLAKHIVCDDNYVPDDTPNDTTEPTVNPRPEPPANPPVNPNPPQPPNPNPPQPPVNPDPPQPPANPNQINITGSRQANGQPNIFDLRDRPGTRRNLQIAPNSGAIVNNLNQGVDANVGANFAGYIGGFAQGNTPGVVIRGQGGGVNAIAHSFTAFQDPIDNTAGTAPIDVELSEGGAPDRMIVIAGQGRIRGVENLTVMGTRTGQNGNQGFDISGAENVRIVATAIREEARQGQTRVFVDERGLRYRIQDSNNSVNVSATGSRDRTNADSTFEDIPGQAPRHGVRQTGGLPHDTNVITATGERVAVDGISPSNNASLAQLASAPQNNQPTPNRGLGTATLA